MTGEDDGQENSSYVNGASPWLAYIGCIWMTILLCLNNYNSVKSDVKL